MRATWQPQQTGRVWWKALLNQCHSVVKKELKSPTKPSRNIKRWHRTHLLIALTPYLKKPGAILKLNLTAVASVTWKPFHAATVHNRYKKIHRFCIKGTGRAATSDILRRKEIFFGDFLIFSGPKWETKQSEPKYVSNVAGKETHESKSQPFQLKPTAIEGTESMDELPIVI